jgi:hypothetical protein
MTLVTTLPTPRHSDANAADPTWLDDSFGLAVNRQGAQDRRPSSVFDDGGGTFGRWAGRAARRPRGVAARSSLFRERLARGDPSSPRSRCHPAPLGLRGVVGAVVRFAGDDQIGDRQA